MSKSIKLDYPAELFEQAFPLGNGFLGAMYYGNPALGKISLNLDSLWSGYSRWKGKKDGYIHYPKIVQLTKSGNKQKASQMLKKYFYSEDADVFMPLGNLYVKNKCFHFDREKTNYSRCLDLSTGTVFSEYTEKGFIIKEKCFCSNPDNVFVLRIESENNSLNRVIEFQHVHKGYAKYTNTGLKFLCKCPVSINPIVYDDSKKTLTGIGELKINTDGIVICTNKDVEVTNAKYIEIYLYATTNYYDCQINPDKVTEKLNFAVNKGFDNLLQDHIEDYKKLFDKSVIELCGSKFADQSETMLNFGKYLLISCSRKGSLPANLQGIWNESNNPIWGSGYTMNINLQMNYWGAEQLGLTECVEPLCSFIQRLSKSGHKTAKELFGVNGWCTFHNSDIWNMTTPVGGEHEGDPSRYAWFIGAAGWLCLHIYEHWQYTEDMDYLKNVAYPIMLGAVEFYLSVLQKVNGKYVLCPGASPETGYLENGQEYFISSSTAIDCAVIQGLFKHFINVTDFLNINDEITQKVIEILPYLKFVETDDDGCIIEWDKPYTDREIHNSHISHLYFNFPEFLNVDGKYDFAVRKTLEKRGNGGSGWSIAWKANQYARLHDGETAACFIDRLYTNINVYEEPDYKNGAGIYPNLFCAHPPFQIDGNFGIMSAITELLMQSHYDKIELLPAPCSMIKEGKVQNLHAKGGFLVSFSFKNGMVTEYCISHPWKDKCLISVNGKTKKVSTNCWQVM